MDDNGIITGSNLLFNHKQSIVGIFKISSNLDNILKYHQEKIANSIVDKYVFITSDT